MKKNSLYLLGVMGCALFFGACLGRREPPQGPLVIAFVNGQALYEEGLRIRLGLEQTKYPPEKLKEPAFFEPLKANLLDQMITQRLISDWGHKQGIILTDQEMALGIENLKKGYTSQAFDEFLAENKISQSHWRDMAVEKIFVEKTLAEKVYQSIQITPKEVSQYYQKNLKEFDTPERVRVRHLVTDTEDKAIKLYERLKNGENFAKLAIMNSQSPDRSNGGDLGFFAKGTYPQEFDEACFKLKPGELSPVVKSPYGFHIFKMIEKKPAGILGLEEVASKIYGELLKQKTTQVYTSWFESIKNESQVQIIEKNLKQLKL